MTERLTPFTFLEMVSVAIIAVPVMSYRSGLYNRRARHGARAWLITVIPVAFLVLQLLAFGIVIG